jgi:hypothetical protein
VKLILRTAAVKMFFVHYLTELERISPHRSTDGTTEAVLVYDEEPTVMYPSVASLLHYKEDEGTIFGQILGRDAEQMREHKVNRCSPRGVLGYRDIRRFQDERLLERVQKAVEARGARHASSETPPAAV